MNPIVKHRKRCIPEEEENLGSSKRMCIESGDAVDTTCNTGIAGETQYTIIPGATTKNRDKLFDNKGFSYHIHMPYVNKEGIILGSYWRCSRFYACKCKARIFQKEDTLSFSMLTGHNHLETNSTNNMSIEITRRVAKDTAQNNPSGSRKNIIKMTLAKIASITGEASPMKSASLAMVITRCRKSQDSGTDKATRKKNKTPKKSNKKNATNENIIDFSLYPQLIIKDLVKTDENGSIMITSKRQIKLLSSSVYLTFSLSTESICPQYAGLILIQSYCQNKEALSKVNLVHILLPSLNQSFLKESLQQFYSQLPKLSKTGRFVVQPNPILWSAMKEVFPDVELKCNLFEWTKAIDEQIDHLSLSKELPVVCKLRCLNLIPVTEVTNSFYMLKRESIAHKEDSNYAQLKQLLAHVRKYWLENETWQPSNWVAFDQIFDDEALTYLSTPVANITKLLSQLSRNVTKVGVFKAVTDLESIEEYVLHNGKSECIGQFKKCWNKYNKSKYNCAILLDKLSQISY